MQKIVDDEKKKKDDELKAKEKEELAKVQCQEVIEAAIIDVNSKRFNNDKNGWNSLVAQKISAAYEILIPAQIKSTIKPKPTSKKDIVEHLSSHLLKTAKEEITKRNAQQV